MSTVRWFLFLFLSILTAFPAVWSQKSDLLTPAEQNSLQRANNLDRRLKVYLTAAAARLQKVAALGTPHDPETLSSAFQPYRELLRLCSEEMDKQPPVKARQAKQHEILLRKQIQLLDDLYARADLEDQPLIREATDSAQQLRTRFLQIFFGPGAIKGPKDR